MYTALYREYRPETFDEILGQEHIVKILKNQISTNSVSHAYLFCGTRGTGKTTTARILAKGLNCLADGNRPCGICSVCESIKSGTFLDVIEIDAASNNGVDNIREIRESVKYPPAAGRKKVYIIDEVHMLSSGAFNALLKTLEEPPDYVVFILATTEPQKLPATVLSRCMRLDFKRVPENVLIKGMASICVKRGIEVTEDALRIISANADGSVRDGLSILDQCISGGEKKVDAKDVLEFLGASGEETFIELTEFVRKRRTSDALLLIAQVLSDGKDVRQFIKDWINHYRNLLMLKFIRDPRDVINLSAENIERLRRQSEAIELNDINRGILELSETMREAKWSTQPRILLELSIVKLSTTEMYEKAEEFIAPAPKKQASHETTVPDVVAEHPVKKKIEDEHDEKTGFKNADADNAGISNNAVNQNDDADDFDYEKIWGDVFRDGEAAKGSFYIIGNSARLVDVDKGTFTVSVKSEYVKKHTENNRGLLEDLMEKHTGIRRSMRIVTDEDGTKKSDRSVEEIAANAGRILGIDIEIQ